MNANATHHSSLIIAATHPALPGHFPGQPLVPGVVLLDQVLAQAEQWLGRPLSAAALTQVKFIAPLRPAQEARLQLQLHEQRLRFEISCAGGCIAQGSFRLGPDA